MSLSRALLLAAALALAAPAQAEVDPVATARHAADLLQAAAADLAEAERARDRVAALTRTVRAYEEGLVALREGLRRAAVRERALRLQFEARRSELARLLGVLQTLERAPAPLLMIHPSGPLGSARSGMILSEVAPALQARAEALGADLAEVATLQALQESVAEDLARGLHGVQEARAALSKAIAERTDLPQQSAASAVELAILADSAETLDGFANSLAAMDPPDPAQAGLADFAGLRFLPLPVAGAVLRGFQQADAAGIRRPGVVLAAPPRSLVSTPVAATLRYLGPLLDYGNVMILEPGGDYLMVLAGLDQVYGAVGDILPAGTPVGLLGGEEPDTEEFLLEAAQGGGTSRQETLYMEVRQAGTPVDPMQWFAPQRE